MKNSQFCRKVTGMLGTSLRLVEVERDYFQVKPRSVWLRDDQTIYLSDEFTEWVKVFAWRTLKKHVVWDNIQRSFWFESNGKASK